MRRQKLCSSCGVPRDLARRHVWGDNGTITQAANPLFRIVLLDVDLLAEVFRDIRDMLGVPVDHIIEEGKRKGTLEYVTSLFAGVKLRMMRTIGYRRAYERLTQVGSQFGYGHFEIVDARRGEYVELLGRNVYYLPYMIGDLEGTFNAIEGLSAAVDLEREDGGYRFTVTPGSEDIVLSARIRRRRVAPRPGDIELERCPACGAPRGLARFSWDLEEGILTDAKTGLRSCLLDPEDMDAVFRELEAELGEDIPRAIVDAQRRYARRALEREGAELGRDSIRSFLALRGMGNLAACEDGGDSMLITAENAAPPLLVAGILQGIYELKTGSDSTCDSDLGDDGVLAVTMRRARPV